MDFALSPDQESFVAEVRAFARDHVAPRAAAIDAGGAFPRELVRDAGRLGLMGMTVPAGRGGAGRDYVSYALAVEAVAFASATLAVILTVNNSLVAEPLLEFGSAAQQEQWLARLASGTAIGAFAL
ncbi:MAG TPA: acyl-CoA dehydrogenase family protein, partial [Vicinamibacterales bacterium]